MSPILGGGGQLRPQIHNHIQGLVTLAEGRGEGKLSPVLALRLLPFMVWSPNLAILDGVNRRGKIGIVAVVVERKKFGKGAK